MENVDDAISSRSSRQSRGLTEMVTMGLGVQAGLRHQVRQGRREVTDDLDELLAFYDSWPSPMAATW